MYHTLGMECMSPFKNLWLGQMDLIRMVPSLKEYMKEELKFSRWGMGNAHRYPVMSLKGIEIHFNHDRKIDEAVDKWNRRKEKINYDNLFVMIYTSEANIVEKFVEELQGYRKICFVPNDMERWTDHQDVWNVKLMPGQTELWDCVNRGVENGKNALIIDILKMLGGHKTYRYEL